MIERKTNEKKYPITRRKAIEFIGATVGLAILTGCSEKKPPEVVATSGAVQLPEKGLAEAVEIGEGVHEFQVVTADSIREEKLTLQYNNCIHLFIRQAGPIEFQAGIEQQRYPGEILAAADGKPVIRETMIRPGYLEKGEIESIGLLDTPGIVSNVTYRGYRIAAIVLDKNAYFGDETTEYHSSEEKYYIIEAATVWNQVAFPDEPHATNPKDGLEYSHGCLVFQREGDILRAIGWMSSVEPWVPVVE